MATAGSGTNVRLTGHVNVWYDADQPTEIHLTINDEDVAHPVTGQDGVHLAVSSNPRSANFNPKPFNTFRALLMRMDKGHPPHEADETIPRRLDRRRDWL
jgi:hypothetical protein